MKKLRCVAGLLAVWVGLGLGSGAQEHTSQGRDAGHPAAKRAMTFADLMAMKRVSDPQVSPSGKWVMFSVTDVSLEKNTKVNHLWVVALDPTHAGKAVMNGAPGSGVERQVTFGAGESFGRFSPDGKWVSMTVGDDVWLAPWDEAAGTVGTAKQLTRVSGGGADGAVWSPDSKRLMFAADVWPGCSVKGEEGQGGTSGTTEILTGGQNDEQRQNAGVLRSAQNDSGLEGGGGTPYFVVGGTREVLNRARDGGAVTNGAPSSWAEEDACDKARDEAVAGSAVKGQVWDGLLYRHWDHFTGAKRSHVLVVNADGSGVRDLTPASVVGDAETPTFSLGGPLGYAWAPDSKEIAYVTNLDKVPAASTNNDVFTLRLDEAGAKAVKVSTSPGSDDGPAYSPDGKWLAFRSQARNGFESDRFRLMLLDREKKTLAETVPHDDDWVDEFAWSPDSQHIFSAGGYHGAEVIGRLALNPRRPTATVNGEHSMIRISGQGEFSSIAITPDGRNLVAVGMKAYSPAELFTFVSSSSCDSMFGDVGPSLEELSRYDNLCSDGGANGGAGHNEPSHLLTHLNEAVVDQLAMPPLEPFWFHGAEGTQVEGFIMRPPGFDAAKKYPVKFLMHGGPQTAWGDAWSYRWNWELMAANGYVVVGINRRGSTGYGQKFVDEVSGDWGGRAYEDLMKGLDYAEAHYSFIDKTRECALGASYGGFMADWVLTHTNRFQCIVTHDGMYDPVAAYGSTEEMWFNEWEFRRPQDFPKGWDGFAAGYNPMGRRTKTNAGVSPLRPAASGRDDGVKGPAASGRDDGVKGPAGPGQDDGVKGAAGPGQDDGVKGAAGPGRDDGVKGAAGRGQDDGVKGAAAPGRDDGVNGSAASGRDDGVKGAAASGRDDDVKGPAGPGAGPTHRDRAAMNGAQSVDRDGRPAQPWRYAGLAADQDPFRKWSPMLSIENAKTPTLVIHSQKDMRLDVSQGMELFTALQRLGVPSEMLYFPDEGHWILKPQNAEVWNEVVGDWCDRWTKTGKYGVKE